MKLFLFSTFGFYRRRLCACVKTDSEHVDVRGDILIFAPLRSYFERDTVCHHLHHDKVMSGGSNNPVKTRGVCRHVHTWIKIENKFSSLFSPCVAVCHACPGLRPPCERVQQVLGLFSPLPAVLVFHCEKKRAFTSLDGGVKNQNKEPVRFCAPVHMSDLSRICKHLIWNVSQNMDLNWSEGGGLSSQTAPAILCSCAVFRDCGLNESLISGRKSYGKSGFQYLSNLMYFFPPWGSQNKKNPISLRFWCWTVIFFFFFYIFQTRPLFKGNLMNRFVSQKERERLGLLAADWHMWNYFALGY